MIVVEYLIIIKNHFTMFTVKGGKPVLVLFCKATVYKSTDFSRGRYS